MGDVMTAANPFSTLASQVNRFGPSAPAAYQMTQQVFPLATGTLDPQLAMAAVLIYQRRATEAYNQFHDAGSAQAIEAANAGFGRPVEFVTGNLAEVTQAIANFADSLGLPAAITTSSGGTGIGTKTLNTLLLGAGAILVLWAVTR